MPASKHPETVAQARAWGFTLAAVLAAAYPLSACAPSAASEAAAAEAAAPIAQSISKGSISSVGHRFRSEKIVDLPGEVSASICSSSDADALAGATYATCEVLTIEFGGLTYRAFLFSRSSARLTIFHEGHIASGRQGLADSLMPDARELLTEILQFSDVLYFDMPLLGVNSNQEMIIKGRRVSATTHDRFALLDSPENSALAYFLNPVNLAVNSLASHYSSIKMIGRSGGGWATTLYAALDPRIIESISVAGTAPIVARSIDSDGRDDLGDWEQFGATVYRYLDYEDIYALAASDGRRHEQVYLQHDNCCFSGVKAADARAIFEAKYGTALAVSFSIIDGASDHYAMPTHMLAEMIRD